MKTNGEEKVYEIVNANHFNMLIIKMAGLVFHRKDEQGRMFIKPLKSVEKYVKPFAL